jgi:hypothetical protein
LLLFEQDLLRRTLLPYQTYEGLDDLCLPQYLHYLL